MIPGLLTPEQVVEDAELDWGLGYLLRQVGSGPGRGRRMGVEMGEGTWENLVQISLALLTLYKFRG